MQASPPIEVFFPYQGQHARQVPHRRQRLGEDEGGVHAPVIGELHALVVGARPDHPGDAAIRHQAHVSRVTGLVNAINMERFLAQPAFLTRRKLVHPRTVPFEAHAEGS